MPMAHGLPHFPSGLSLGLDAVLWVDVFDSGLGEWKTYQTTVGAVVALTSGGVVDLVDGPTITLNAGLGSTFRVTLGGNRALDITNPTDGQSIDLEVTQGSGGQTLALPSGAGGVRYGTDAPSGLYVLSTGAGLTDYLRFKYRASADRWDFIGFIRGY